MSQLAIVLQHSISCMFILKKRDMQFNVGALATTRSTVNAAQNLKHRITMYPAYSLGSKTSTAFSGRFRRDGLALKRIVCCPAAPDFQLTTLRQRILPEESIQ
jgi:hypothetical protein